MALRISPRDANGETVTGVGIVGCGYVFDHYMATWASHPELEIRGVTDLDRNRTQAVSQAYGLKVYDTIQELLADPLVDIVLNLTSIQSHYEVTKTALLAGKHVYSEKPLTTDLEQAQELVRLAERKGLVISCAPSNALSDTVRTMWRAVVDGAVGDVRIVYAEFDDNPVYLMHPEGWRSATGARWPYLHEYEQGCTVEHIGYHLTWLCAILGPVESVTAFSACTLPDKASEPLDPPDTPDFSVAALAFASGVVARVTCSIGAPLDHRMRIVGNRGMLSVDTYRNYRCPVYLERFSSLSLNARKSYTVRQSRLLRWLFGVGGKRLRLLDDGPGRPVPPDGRAWRSWRSPGRVLDALKKREVGAQDKCLGIAEMARALHEGRVAFPSHDFILHVTELTLAVQNAGTRATTHVLNSKFDPVPPPDRGLHWRMDYAGSADLDRGGRVVDRVLARLHRH